MRPSRPNHRPKAPPHRRRRTPFSAPNLVFPVFVSVSLFIVGRFHTIIPTCAYAQSATPTSYSVYNYDLTTPRFTPDGRLMQVEYACRAPDLSSSPLLAVPVWDDDGGAVVLATIVGGGGPAATTGDGDEESLSGSVDSGSSNSKSARSSTRGRRGQSRLVTLPIGPPPSLSSDPSPCVVLGLSGVLSDSVSLLRTAREHVTAYGRTYGLHRLHPTAASASLSSSGPATPSSAGASPPDVARRIALAVGDECQSRSFGGGIRPYGSSVLVCGVDGNECCICITDAGGGVSIRRTAFGVGGGGSANAAKAAVIVGGPSAMRTRLRRALEVRLGEDSEKCNRGPVRRTAEAAVCALLDSREEGTMALRNAKEEGDGNRKEGGEVNNIRDNAPTLEVVVVARAGSYRLSEDQIRRMMVSVAST